MTGPTYFPAEKCPDAATHTPCPSGYVQWHEWAEEKAKTHRTRRCPTCRLWVIWEPRGVAG